jgi:hypothetical protein
MTLSILLCAICAIALVWFMLGDEEDHKQPIRVSFGFWRFIGKALLFLLAMWAGLTAVLMYGFSPV